MKQFSLKSGCPQDTWMPIWLNACQEHITTTHRSTAVIPQMNAYFAYLPHLQVEQVSPPCKT